MRKLILKGSITALKSLAAPKIMHLLLITELHNKTIDLLRKIRKNFIWQEKKAKN